MILSYAFRLVCLLAVVCGLVYAVVQFILSLNARLILRRLQPVSARRRERAFYWLQIAPLVLAAFVGLACCLPEYLLFEPTHEIEPVGRLSVILGAAAGLWFGSAVLRGLRITCRTLRFSRFCRRSGKILRHPGGGPPIVALTGQNPPVALVGFVRPCILIAADFLETGVLNNDALQIAFDHERSHASHRDNWKLLFLNFLPRFYRWSGSRFWYEHWQRAADWAADDDAVRGDRARSLLLAEALVRTARSVTGAGSNVLCTALTSAEEGLALRIDRLLHPRPETRSGRNAAPLGMAAGLLVVLSIAGIASPWLYRLSEHILHLSGF